MKTRQLTGLPAAATKVAVLAAFLLVGAAGIGISGLIPTVATADDDEPLGWMNRNYFKRGTDDFTKGLLANVERNHFAQENFWEKYRSGQLKYALDDLSYALRVFPNHPRALHMMALICKSLNDTRTPAMYFEKAILLFPNEPYTYAQYGAFLLDTGDTTEAVSRLNDALRLDPNLTYALGLLAEAQKRHAPTSPSPATPAPPQSKTTGSAPPSTASGTPTVR